MCSRFENSGNPRDLAGRFGLPAAPALANRCEFRPTDSALIVESGGLARLAQWGLPAPWDGKPLINARAETLSGKPAFQGLLQNRCLVPATAWFEWRKTGTGKHKNRIGLAGGGLFAFAGLTDGAHFTIITCAPAPSIAPIHERMPVVLAPAWERPWLDNRRPFAEAAAALAPFAVAPLAAVEEAATPPPQGDLFG